MSVEKSLGGVLKFFSFLISDSLRSLSLILSFFHILLTNSLPKHRSISHVYDTY